MTAIYYRKRKDQRGHILSRDLSGLFLALNSLGQNGNTFYYFLEAKQTKKQTNKLYLTRVTLNSEITDKPVALGFQIELEFGNVGF